MTPNHDDGDRGYSARNEWRTAQNLTQGDVVLLNSKHEFRVENKTTDEAKETIEYLGQITRDGGWRVLRVATNRVTPPTFTRPERKYKTAIVEIEPVAETITSAETAASLFPPDVFDTASDEKQTRISGENNEKIAECPVCDGSIYRGDGIVRCERCGAWVEDGVWFYWSERSNQVEYNPEKYADAEPYKGLDR